MGSKREGECERSSYRGSLIAGAIVRGSGRIPHRLVSASAAPFLIPLSSSCNSLLLVGRAVSPRAC